VQESLVLLKNQNNVLPLKMSNIKYVILVGERIININGMARNELFRSFDDIGMQNGGGVSGGKALKGTHNG
jgi:hypothetical protein